MSVSLRKTSKGEVFEVRYRDTDGSQRRVTLGTRAEGWDRRKARAEERRLLVEASVFPSSSTFAEVADRWFKDSRKNWKPRTEAAYRRSINRLEVFSSTPVNQIRPKHVAEWIPQHPFSAKTTNDDISVLHQIFDYAIRHELVESNPAAAAPRPKIRRRKWRILTPEEIQKVDKAFESISFDDLNGRWDEVTARRQAQLIFRVLTRTGIRRDELRNLKVGDIDFDRGVIRIRESKTEEGERSIAIPKTLVKDLEVWLSGEGGASSAAKGQTNRQACVREDEVRGDNEASNSNAYNPSPESHVFQSSRGNKVGGQWYTDQFNKALAEAGISDYVRPFHDMRHTALTNEAATGKSSPIALMAKAGHRSFSTTRRYMQLAGVVFHDEAEALEERLSGK